MKMCFFFCFFHLLTIFPCLRFVVLVTFFLSFDVFFSQNFSCGRFVPQTERVDHSNDFLKEEFVECFQDIFILKFIWYNLW